MCVLYHNCFDFDKDLFAQMSTFLHRVRGPTIGYSCLDLFVVTNASISNVSTDDERMSCVCVGNCFNTCINSQTIAAVASYFLIVADFSRSTVAASEAAARAEKAVAEAEARASEANWLAISNMTTLDPTLMTEAVTASM